jgi:outer membrane protein assembly factor BamB
VILGGEKLGVTPLLTSYRPHDEPGLELRLEGFEPVRHEMRHAEGLRFSVVMTRTSAWTHRLQGLVERRAAFDAERGVYVADRSGRVTAFDRRSGDVLWQLSTLDLSGLLPTPVVWRDQVLVTSLDGPVRCLARSTGAELWERDGMPCEAAPVVVDGVLYVATVDGRLVLLDLAGGGAAVHQAELPGPVSRDLHVLGKSVYLVTSDGWVARVDTRGERRGRVLWKKRVGNSVTAALCVDQDLIAVGNAEGRVVALEPDQGKVRWERVVARGELRHAPVSLPSRIVVAVDDRLIGLDKATGEPSGEFRGKAPWSAAPAVARDMVLAGDAEGIVVVLDGRALELRHQLRGESAVAGPVSISSDGWLLVGFEGREIVCYKP